MTDFEPELITIIEGPTPEFQPAPHRWLQSMHEGPIDQMVALCQLRTNNGLDIMERCQQAWSEFRLVKLDFPDELRMRQQVDVISMRLDKTDEGDVLLLWIAEPVDLIEEEEGEGFDGYEDDDDGLDYF